MTIDAECRLWGDRLADGIEAKRRLMQWHRDHWLYCMEAGFPRSAKQHRDKMRALKAQIAAVEAAARKRR